MKKTLTIEESARLIEPGVDAKLASESEIYDEPCHRSYMAVFTLADLLSILPKEIEVDKVKLSLVMEWQCDKWYACYMGRGRMVGDCSAPELIDALNQLLFCTIEQGYLKTENK